MSMPANPCVAVGGVTFANTRPLALIAGPCALESRAHALEMAAALKEIAARVGIGLVFKTSFDKANRTSAAGARGLGLAQALPIFAEIRETLGLPVLTDVHERAQCAPVAEAVDVLQIPAFLCRQTDLLAAAGQAAAAHNRAVNVKKGQFLSPGEMTGPVRKLAEAGCTNVLLTERGTTFGYHRLINDFIGLGDLMALGTPGGPPPVCFDVTHSTQTPGTGEQTGGRPDRAALLARAATAAGAHALFIECHPDPRHAMSDAATQLPLSEIDALIRTVAAIRRAIS
jgi:2-dehydro-3-deoxyphosphooctonate aldolase (KDO 8-P synthase)